MQIDFPFVKSRGFECGQACAAMMIKFFQSDFEPDFDEMNKIIHHKKGMYTFPPQLGILLNQYGVQSHVYSSDDIRTMEEDPDQFKRWFGNDYEHELKYLDFPTIDWMVGEARKHHLFTVKTTEFDELLARFRKGEIVGFPIDWNTVNGKGGPYAGHFIIITGLEGDDLLVHDPDVGPYQHHPLSTIRKAWEHPAIADDFLVAINPNL